MNVFFGDSLLISLALFNSAHIYFDIIVTHYPYLFSNYKNSKIIHTYDSKTTPTFLKQYTIKYNVVCCFNILPPGIYNLPTLGTVNIHYSLLPLYKGPDPIICALYNFDNITGISFVVINNNKIDDGPIVQQEVVSISLLDRLTMYTLIFKCNSVAKTMLKKLMTTSTLTIYDKKITNDVYVNMYECQKMHIKYYLVLFIFYLLFFKSSISIYNIIHNYICI